MVVYTMTKRKQLTLKEYLKTYKISGKSFAKLIPCTQPHISLIINEKTEPSFNMAKRIEQVTNGIVPRTMWYPNE